MPSRDTDGNLCRLVGFWRGVPGHPADFLGYPDPSLLVTRDWNHSERRRVVEYLRRGSVLARYMGVSYCRFQGCAHPQHQLGTCDLTDGAWVWPEGLWHYVEHHRVRLPAEFIDSIAARAFAISPPGGDVRSVRPSPAFWLDWAACNTPAPRAAPGACSLPEAQSLCAALATGHWSAEITGHLGRWRIQIRVGRDLADAERWCDYTGPIARHHLQEYLFKTRRPEPDAVLSYDRAVAVADEYATGGCLARPIAYQRTIEGEIYWAVISSSKEGPSVPFQELDLSSLTPPDPGWALFLPGGWKVQVMRGMDEPAWRFFLQAWRHESHNNDTDGR